MCAHLDEFRQRMQTRGNEESLGLEEAAWYLSSLANYDFGDVKEEFTDMRFDTLHFQITVSNGEVAISDLNTLYNNVHNQLETLYQQMDLLEQSPFYIDAEISDNGLVTIYARTSYRVLDHYWYFHSAFHAYPVIHEYFSEDTVYNLNQNFITAMQNYLYCRTGHPETTLPLPSTGRVFYVFNRQELFMYDDPQYVDPYGSPFVGNSRIYHTMRSDTLLYGEEEYQLIEYMADSYPALGLDEAQDTEVILDWTIGQLNHYYGYKFKYYYHIPSVRYGTVIIVDNPPID